MKIDPQRSAELQSGANAVARTLPSSSDAESPEVRADGNSDEIAVSAPTSDILYGQDKRLERLKQLYQDGHYSIPSSAIARKIVDEHEES